MWFIYTLVSAFTGEAWPKRCEIIICFCMKFFNVLWCKNQRNKICNVKYNLWCVYVFPVAMSQQILNRGYLKNAHRLFGLKWFNLVCGLFNTTHHNVINNYVQTVSLDRLDTSNSSFVLHWFSFEWLKLLTTYVKMPQPVTAVEF
jgi:hypothetical protein